MSLSRRVRLFLGLLLGSVVLSGCDFDVYALPLPGGTDVGDNPIEVTVQFADVLDLVPKSTVKVNDVSVGKVTAIDLDGYSANVTLLMRNDIKLPDNAIAEIRQTSLLGEKFVSLSAPESGASQTALGDGDVIPLERTGRNPEVEEVLGALSLILNGGGVAQLKTISQELNKALTGREDSARSVLSQIDTFTETLDTNKGQIVKAIEALNRLAVSARQQEGNIDEALEELPSALISIDGQRQDLVAMLQALAQLSDVGVRVIKASKVATIDSLRQLQPVLNQLAESGDNFVKAFHVFLTYPFVDEVVGRDPQVARNLHMGDYTNLSVTLDIDLTQGLPTAPGCPPTRLHPAERDPAGGGRCLRWAWCGRGGRDQQVPAVAPRRELWGAADVHREPGVPASLPVPVLCGGVRLPPPACRCRRSGSPGCRCDRCLRCWAWAGVALGRGTTLRRAVRPWPSCSRSTTRRWSTCW